MNKIKLFLMLITVFIMSSCNKNTDADKPHLLIYCGITMVKPISEISSIFEKEYDCKITIAQGGSEDLYQSLKVSKIGDMYLPGSDSYKTKYLSEGLLLNDVEVGYNQMAFLVQKGNPLHIKGDLAELASQDYAVFLGNPETCSAGKTGKKILENSGIFDVVLRNCTGIAADSRDINKYLLNKQADLALNWKATAFFDNNHEAIDIIPLDESIAPRKKLLLIKLKFTKYPQLVDKFMEYTVSEQGRQIFKKYGFIE